MPYSLGVIGFGQIAQAIVIPLITQKIFLPEKVFGVVRRESNVDSLLQKLPKGVSVVSSENNHFVDVLDAPIQILAVKPKDLSSVAKTINNFTKQQTRNPPLLISVLAGVTLTRLEKTFPNHICVRTVPNTPSLVGKGLTGICFGKDVTEEHRQIVDEIFKSSSEVFNLQEDKLDAFLALTSSGPAYVALIIESLADGAVAAGLSRSLAQELSIKTLLGSSFLLSEYDLHPGELKDMVASPGGTTITALRHLEMSGLRSALIEAVMLAAEKSRSLS